MNTATVPREAIAIYNNALQHTNKGDLESAVTEYQRAIELYPNFVEAYNNIGEVYSQMGKRDLAISSYLDALRIEKNSRVLLNLGVEHYSNKNYKKSLTYFKESITLDPLFLEGNFYTGLIYYDEKDYGEAEFYFRNVLAIDTKHLKANYLLSYIYYEWKEYQKTLECLDNIKDIADDKPFMHRYYGFCYYHLGDYDRAVEHLTTALKSKPEYKRFKKYLSSLTYEKKMKEIGDLDKAIRELEEQMMQGEARLTEATKLSMLYIFNGQNKKAEELILSVKQKMAS